MTEGQRSATDIANTDTTNDRTERRDGGAPSDDHGQSTERPSAQETRLPFWQRPNVERHLVPLLAPIAVAVGIAVYVLDLSRIFLSAHGHTSVVVGAVITGAILLGATVLSNSTRLRAHTTTLMTGVFLLVIVGSGWLVLGHSQVKNVNLAVLTKTGPAQGSFTITASPTGGFSFAPTSLTVKTGIYTVTLRDGAAATHTLNFDQSATLWAGLVVTDQGETKTSRIFFGAAGDYTFYCAIPNHRTYGMQGVVHVTGPTMTLSQAENAGKSTAPASASAASSGVGA